MLSHISFIEFSKHFEEIIIVTSDKLARTSADVISVNLLIQQFVEFRLDRVDFGFQVSVSELIVWKSQLFLTLLEYRWLGGLQSLFWVCQLFIVFQRRNGSWKFGSWIWYVGISSWLLVLLAVVYVWVGDSTGGAGVKISTKIFLVRAAFSCRPDPFLILAETIRRFHNFKSLLSHVEYSDRFFFSLAWLPHPSFRCFFFGDVNLRIGYILLWWTWVLLFEALELFLGLLYFIWEIQNFRCVDVFSKWVFVVGSGFWGRGGEVFFPVVHLRSKLF